jgi:hypothetical protein
LGTLKRKQAMIRAKCTTKARITIRNPAGVRSASDFIPGPHISIDVVNRGWWSVASVSHLGN